MYSSTGNKQRRQRDSGATSYNLVELSTNNLIFTMDEPNTKTIYSRFKITNPSNSHRVRFKIRSTSPFYYIVKPYQQTLEPLHEIDISVRIVLGDRDAFKFNMDRFEVLAQIISNVEEALIGNQFWNGAQSQRISVELVRPSLQRPGNSILPMNNLANWSETPNSNTDRKDIVGLTPQMISNRFTNMNPPTKEELWQLEVQCKQLEDKIQTLKARNAEASILQPKNFILAALISFILGFAFT